MQTIREQAAFVAGLAVLGVLMLAHWAASPWRRRRALELRRLEAACREAGCTRTQARRIATAYFLNPDLPERTS